MRQELVGTVRLCLRGAAIGIGLLLLLNLGLGSAPWACAQTCPTIAVIIPEEVRIRQIVRRVPDPAAETAIVEKFVDAGFHVVDPEQVRLIRYTEVVEQALQGDPEAILQLSERFAADILVLGEAFSVVEVVRVPGQTEQLQQGRARVEVRVVEAATGRILKAAALHTGGLDFYAETAAKKALERAGAKVACELAQAIARRLPSGCFSGCSLPTPTYGGLPFENPAGFLVSGEELRTMVETALSQQGLTVAEPLAADFVVTGTISDWSLVLSPMIRLPVLDVIFRVGVMTVTIDLKVLDLDTAEFKADVITEHIEGIEIFGFRFGLNPRDLARKAAQRIAERVAALGAVVVSRLGSGLDAEPERLGARDMGAAGVWSRLQFRLRVRPTPQGLSVSLPADRARALRLEVYDLAGREVYDSDFVAGQALRWRPQTRDGRPMANGVYLYVISVRMPDGHVLRSDVRKLVILR